MKFSEKSVKLIKVMKKYLQITAVLVVFGLLVLARQIKGSDDTPPIIAPTNNNSITTQPTESTSASTGSTGSPTPTTATAAGQKYKDGIYTGSVADAYYGNIQIKATITGGKITDVEFLQYPNDNRTSQFVNSQAMPYLKQEALQAQSAQVDIVSGASQTSQAFQQSLSSALQQAI